MTRYMNFRLNTGHEISLKANIMEVIFNCFSYPLPLNTDMKFFSPCQGLKSIQVFSRYCSNALRMTPLAFISAKQTVFLSILNRKFLLLSIWSKSQGWLLLQQSLIKINRSFVELKPKGGPKNIN